MPVSDTTELIRNVDMVEDYSQRLGIDKKIDELKKNIQKAIDSAKNWFGK